MTRNCLNVMQKYANMDKEAGAWDRIVRGVSKHLPQLSGDSLLQAARGLYARRITRAQAQRLINSVNRNSAIVNNPKSLKQYMDASDQLRRTGVDLMLPPNAAPAQIRWNAREFNKRWNQTPVTHPNIVYPDNIPQMPKNRFELVSGGDILTPQTTAVRPPVQKRPQ